MLSKRFAQIPDEAKVRGEAKADALLRTASFRKRSQSVLGIDATEPAAILPAAPMIKMTEPELRNLRNFVTTLLPAAQAPAPAGAVVHDKIALQFIRVACIDETNGWFGTEAGSDEISIGGVRFDTDGRTAEIGSVDLGGNWDDGDVRDFKPPKSIFSYSLRGGLTFPRAVFATLVLVERDGGGMEKIIDEVVKKIAAEVKTSLAALLGAAIGGAAGGPVGVLIGLAVGYAVDKLVAWLGSLWEDIAFIPRTIEVQVPSRTSTFSGSLTMPSTVVRFRGPGEYACRYQWVLS
ncbi:hypothetical protein GCM10023320_23700 [Pseudonocardia adelaidensis]|uniref:Uncharacterized protein n=1 Tax=Pseudonocardia adelaidensis TaxID=648754 RepID=A0ABP9NM03_9PSEU